MRLSNGLRRPAFAVAALSLAALTLAPLASCNQLGGLADALRPYTPKLHFKNLAVQGLSFQKIDVDFVFTIDNPNPLDVKLDTFSYALGLEGVQLLSGVNEQGVALKANGSSELALPVSLAFKDIFDAVDAASGKDNLTFGLSGDFGFNTPVGVAKVPFKEEGTFPVIHAPDVSLEGLQMGKLDLLRQTATLNLQIGVANPRGGSALSFSGFDYNVALGESRVASGLVNDIPEVETGARQVVSIPLNLDLRSIGGALVAAITGKQAVDVKLGATVEVGTPFGKVPLSIDQAGNLKIF
ncbi:MAG: hypothetical protein CVU56_03860 [Deltaproteobacteria bacterium HGW-Deltaproteobacteria-14]|jgi:LEA14-like dessication related protein|nr:MAG: hypothetical protein CVU56_03860 [Deltaproteobacteria bacterium HGW-Deltaproteobacteria-14]